MELRGRPAPRPVYVAEAPERDDARYRLFDGRAGHQRQVSARRFAGDDDLGGIRVEQARAALAYPVDTVLGVLDYVRELRLGRQPVVERYEYVSRKFECDTESYTLSAEETEVLTRVKEQLDPSGVFSFVG